MPMNAKLQIQVSLRNGNTYLKQCYATPPFKVADITEDRQSGNLQLMMMCSSPGILDKDTYEIDLLIDDHCSLQLHTQSYQRLFRMQQGATQAMKVHLLPGASLVYLPHPVVPHQHSIFTATSKIYLQPTSKLIWGEIITCGRQLNGEKFSFTKYHNLTEIHLNDKLVVKENLLMQPSLFDVQEMGQLEGFTHQATLLCIGDYGDMPEIMNTIREFLLQQQAIIHGISKAPCKGFIVRILGFKAEQLHHCLKVIGGWVQKLGLPGRVAAL